MLTKNSSGLYHYLSIYRLVRIVVRSVLRIRECCCRLQPIFTTLGTAVLVLLIYYSIIQYW